MVGETGFEPEINNARANLHFENHCPLEKLF
jgi:hypothetical protein